MFEIDDHRFAGMESRAIRAEAEVELLRTTVNHLKDGVIVADSEGYLLEWNPAALKLHGYESVAEVRRHVGDFAETFELTDLEGNVLGVRDWPLMRLMRGEKVDQCELVVRRMDSAGEWIIQYHGSAVKGTDGKATLYVLTLHDVTEARRTEADLRRSNQRIGNKRQLLRTLVEGINDPMYIKDAEGRFMFVNAAVARLGGRTPEECIGVTSREIFGDEIGNRVEASDKLVLESEEARTYEEAVTVAGEKRHYLSTKCRFLNAEGAVAGLFGISRDITSRKAAEQAVLESELHLREVMNSIQVNVVEMSKGGRISSMNGTARDNWIGGEGNMECVLGQHITDVPWVRGWDETKRTLGDAIKAAAEGDILRIGNLRLGDVEAKRMFDVSVAPLHDAKGDVAHLILSAVDITERKVAEETAREQQSELAHLERVQTMGHIASGLAHELNQPLGAIVNYAAAQKTLLAMGKATPESLKEIFESIQGEASRAGEIIRRLRSFVKKQEPQPSTVGVDNMVREALRLLAFDLRQGSVQLELHLASDGVQVYADAIQITQVLVNLLRNAMDAMQGVPAGERKLTVHTIGSQDKVLVRVVDTGPGVAPGQIGKLFDAFYTTKATGLGVGLSLCRMIVERHGGQILAHANADRGMTFEFTLRTRVGNRGG